jgi:tRNA (cytidine/uridine-2'-O-)-methyltransferase
LAGFPARARSGPSGAADHGRSTSLPAARFLPDDILLLGRESAGAPADVHEAATLRVRVPMQPGARSLNVALAAAMVLSEALRQTDGYQALA